VIEHGDLSAFRPGIAWLKCHHIPDVLHGLRGSTSALPLRYTLAELRGVLDAPRAYWRSRRAMRSHQLGSSQSTPRGTM
jgi:hypothetical protein